MESGFSRAGQTLNAVRPNENPSEKSLEDGMFECSPCGLNLFAVDGLIGQTEEREMCVKKKVTGPSKEEFERHQVLRVPYRSWCKNCFKGKRKSDPHKQQRTRVTGK